MAYLYRRPRGRIEIREAHGTPRGPRSRTLVSFRGPLTAAHLDRAEAAARRPFDRESLRRRARELGVATREASADPAARELLARLRRGNAIDPTLVTLLRARLASAPAAPVPEELAEVAEWIGVGDLERGRALRDVLRLYGAIAHAREPVRELPRVRFPRFHSRSERQAS